MAGLGLANSRDFKSFRPRALVFRNKLHMLRSKSRVLKFIPDQNKFKFFREDMPNPGHRVLQKAAQQTQNPGHRDLQQAAQPNKKAVALAPPVKNVLDKSSPLPAAAVLKTPKAVVKVPAAVLKTPKAVGRLKIKAITKLRIKATV